MLTSKEKYRQYLKSNTWRQFRQDVLVSRGFQCEQCGSQDNLEIHHITYRNIFHEIPSDVRILCKQCHGITHGINQATQYRDKYQQIKYTKTPRKPAKHYTLRIKQIYNVKIKSRSWITIAKTLGRNRREPFTGNRREARRYITQTLG